MDNEITARHEEKITRKYIHECFVYDDKTGELFWNVRPDNHFCSKQSANSWNAKYPGRQVNNKGTCGYLRAKLFGRRFYVHRIIWFMVHGKWPANEIDHINRDKADNRILNLREADRALNACNKGKYRVNKTGHKNIYKNRGKTFTAKIQYRQKEIYLGCYKSLNDAVLAYQYVEDCLRA